VDLQELHRFLHAEIEAAQERYKIQADRKRLPSPTLAIGDQVFIISKNIKTTCPIRKLAEKLLGPYEIIAQPSSHAYTLKLPQSMRAVHPVFHISQIEPHVPSQIPDREQSPPPAIELDGDDHYKIREISDSKINRRRRCKLLYLVQWAGYENTDQASDWLPADELEKAKEAVEEFHFKYPNKPGPHNITNIT
jgi:hypothetical protein